MVLAFGSMRKSRSAVVSFFVALITPLASRIHVSRETNVPSCGLYPGLGPRTFGFESLPWTASGSESAPNRVESPAVRAAEPCRKLLRLEKHGLVRGFLYAGIAASFGTDVYGPVLREGFPGIAPPVARQSERRPIKHENPMGA